MLTARTHNAMVRRVLAWTRLVARLDPRLGALLHAHPAAAEVLAGLSGAAMVDAGDPAVAADLLVLLDHLNLHTGTRLSVEPLGSLRYRVHGSGSGDRHEVPRPTAGYRPWPGRVERIAVITRDRPETLSAVLDAFADNLHTFGRGYVGIVVYDDSGVDARHEVRSLVGARGCRYVGPDEKHALRREIGAGLPGPVTERAAVLDALLGRREPDGTWTGSAAAQRNWAILSHAGSRVLVCDDDVRPAVLDAPLDALRAAARAAVTAESATTDDTANTANTANAVAAGPPTARATDAAQPATAIAADAAGPAFAPGELLESFLRTTEVEAWPTDLLGALEDTDAGLVSAAYTGHPDRRTALWLERFFESCDESVDVLGTGIPPQRVRRGAPAATGRRFRGGAFVSSGSLDGLEFAVRRGRNEDFSLALSAQITSPGRNRPAEAGGAHILHLRGPRATSTFTAHREEREGYLVNAVVRAIGDAYTPPFDAEAFRAFGLARLDTELSRAADLADELFDEGLAYRDRARKHSGERSDLWFADPAEERAGLLRDGVDRLADRVVPSDRVLMECAQVLVPQGLLTTLRLPAMREAWRRLSDVDRAEAARCLLDEARYLRSVRRPPTRGVLSERTARKAEQTRELADQIERELPTREAFRADLLRRVRAEVRLYLTAMPYVAPVRAALARHATPAAVEAAR